MRQRVFRQKTPDDFWVQLLVILSTLCFYLIWKCWHVFLTLWHTHLYSRLRADCVVGRYFRPVCPRADRCVHSVKRIKHSLNLPFKREKKEEMKLPDHKCCKAYNLFDVDVSNTLILEKMGLRVEQGSNYRSVREPLRPEGGSRLERTAVSRHQPCFGLSSLEQMKQACSGAD